MTDLASPRRALVVDDHDLNLELASFLLTADGWEVRALRTAAGIEAHLDGWRPDMVLLDIQLPEVDGLTVARRIKSDPRTRSVTVIAFTAYAMKGDEAKAREAGCDGYLSKPIEVASFAERIRAICAAHREGGSGDGVG